MFFCACLDYIGNQYIDKRKDVWINAIVRPSHRLICLDSNSEIQALRSRVYNSACARWRRRRYNSDYLHTYLDTSLQSVYTSTRKTNVVSKEHRRALATVATRSTLSRSPAVCCEKKHTEQRTFIIRYTHVRCPLRMRLHVDEHKQKLSK